jgi:hypothetical protein
MADEVGSKNGAGIFLLSIHAMHPIVFGAADVAIAGPFEIRRRE